MCPSPAPSEAPPRPAPSPPPIEAVLFDVEDVIARPDQAAMARRLAEAWPGLGLAELQAARNGPALYPLWEAYSVGRLDERRYWGAVLAALGRPDDPASVEALIALYADLAWAELDEAVLALAEALRAGGRRIGLLSNSAAHHEARIPGFAGRFDVAHFSHRTGRRKPDPEAYRAAAAALRAAPSAIVFVDDKARNVEAAAALGMRGIRFVDAERLRRELAALGLLGPA